MDNVVRRCDIGWEEGSRHRVMERHAGLIKPIPTNAVRIVNVRSRKGEALFLEAKEKLELAGVRLIASHAVREPAKMRSLVRQAVHDGAPMVIIGGGDGSLPSTVDELVDTACVFAVLPMGTANSFARTLGLPLEIDGAIAAIASGRRRRIDLGLLRVSCRWAPPVVWP
jgi:diacylglycerol kinase family enzyme